MTKDDAALESKSYCPVCKSYTVEKQKSGKYVCLKCGARSAYKTVIDDDDADMLPKSGCGSGLEEEDVIPTASLLPCKCRAANMPILVADCVLPPKYWYKCYNCGKETKRYLEVKQAALDWQSMMGGERG